MKEMVESSKYKGGALMECRMGNLRGDLPSQQSIIVEDMEPAAAEKFFGTLYQPLREVFGKERGVTNGA